MDGDGRAIDAVVSRLPLPDVHAMLARRGWTGGVGQGGAVVARAALAAALKAELCGDGADGADGGSGGPGPAPLNGGSRAPAPNPTPDPAALAAPATPVRARSDPDDDPLTPEQMTALEPEE